MQYTATYDWTYSFSELDTLFIDDVLNWDETTELALSDYNIYSFLSLAFFPASHYFIDNITKLSFLDILFINTEITSASTGHLFTFIVFDLITFLRLHILILFFIIMTFGLGWRCQHVVVSFV